MKNFENIDKAFDQLDRETTQSVKGGWTQKQIINYNKAILQAEGVFVGFWWPHAPRY